MSNLNFPFFISTLTNQKYNIISSEYKIGRNPLSVLPLIHPSVSKEHGELKYNSLTKQLSIRDLNSLNGIYINGKRIEMYENNKEIFTYVQLNICEFSRLTL